MLSIADKILSWHEFLLKALLIANNLRCRFASNLKRKKKVKKKNKNLISRDTERMIHVA